MLGMAQLTHHVAVMEINYNSCHIGGVQFKKEN